MDPSVFGAKSIRAPTGVVVGQPKLLKNKLVSFVRQWLHKEQLKRVRNDYDHKARRDMKLDNVSIKNLSALYGHLWNAMTASLRAELIEQEVLIQRQAKRQKQEAAQRRIHEEQVYRESVESTRRAALGELQQHAASLRTKTIGMRVTYRYAWDTLGEGPISPGFADVDVPATIIDVDEKTGNLTVRLSKDITYDEDVSIGGLTKRLIPKGTTQTLTMNVILNTRGLWDVVVQPVDRSWYKWTVYPVDLYA